MEENITMYRLVALDLDDTLLDKNLEVPAGNKQIVSEVMARGIYVTFATGRMFRSSLPLAKELQIKAPLITYQGALVKHSDTGEVLFHRPVPLDYALDIVSRVGKYGYHINIYLDDYLYVAQDTEAGRRYASLSRIPLEVVGDLGRFLTSRQQDPTKVLVVSTEPRLDELAAELKPIYSDKLHITKSKPHFLEFSHPLANKGHALEAVADYYGVPREKVMAVGDSYNDLEMIDWAGLGVVMGNARKEIKDRADYVTLPHDEGGVVYAMRKFVISE